MKKLFYFLITSISLLASTSCTENDDMDKWRNEQIKGLDSPVEETTDTYHINYQYNEGVIVLSDARQIFLEKTEADTILYFAGNTPEEILPEVGDIVTSAMSSKLPYGLGNVVLSKTKDGNSYKCVTTSASLDQIFSKLEVSATFSILDSLSNGFYDDEGNFIEAEMEKYTRDDETINRLRLKLKKDFNDQISVNGELSFGARPDLEIDILKGHYECSLEVLANFSGGLSLNKFKYEPTKEYIIFSKSVHVKPFNIGPLVLRPFVKIKATVKPDCSGSISLVFSKGEHMKYGYRKNQQYDGLFCDKINDSVEKTSITDPNVEINGNVSFSLPAVDFNFGIYTDDITARITPALKLKYTATIDLKEPNLFRNNSSIKAMISADVDAEIYGRVFCKEFNFRPFSISYDISSYEWPLIPRISENSFKVEKVQSDPLIFNASYRVTEKGLLSEMIDIYPAIHVYKGAEEIYLQKKDQTISEGTQTFKLTGLDTDTHYTAKPAISISGNTYDEDGIPFSSVTPTAAITDIVQTSADYGPGTFYGNGKYWDYEFKFYVNVHLIGSQYCKSWGIYDENSINIYNPCELKDGRQTQYWTAWSNYSSAKFAKRPYVELLDGEILYYEENVHTLQYGNTGTRSIPDIFNEGDIIFRLDSVKVDSNF